MFGYPLKLRPLKNQSDEFLHLDFLRLFGCYWVIISHCIVFAQGSLIPIIFHFHHSPVFVDMFLVISGFVISLIYENRLSTIGDYGIFLLRRLARLAPLHWATLLVFVVLGLLALITASSAPHFSGLISHLTNYDWDCLVPNALALQAFGICRRLSFNYVNWSISAEVGMYLIAPILLWIGRKNRWWPLVLSISSLILLFYISRYTVNPWYVWSWDFGVARAFPDFNLGIAAFFFRREISRIPAAGTIFFSALVAYVIGSFLEWSDTLAILLIYITVITGIACDIQGNVGRWVRTAALGGQLTYSMYLLHPILIAIILSVIGEHTLHLQSTAMNCLLFLTVALVAPVSYLSFELYETPARLWISGAKRRRTGAVKLEPEPAHTALNIAEPSYTKQH